MFEPSTKILDHIVHLTPPGTVELASQQFRDLGFNVIPGGTHTGGLTANALVVLATGSYLELISFTHPASHYPPSSPDRRKRDSNPWSHKHPGWIDYAFLGASDPDVSIAHIINERARLDGSGVKYDPEVDGGRVREDGKTLKWVITVPSEEQRRGSLPFFCGDVTPREWRVPIDPPSNSKHPSGVLGIAHVRILVVAESLDAQSAQLTSVVGDPPVGHSLSGYTWSLETPHSGLEALKPRLILSAPVDEEEETYLAERGPGVYEVAFWVGPEGKERTSATPYGRIVWRVKAT
ncbi:glyoxalase-like domain-containing protein [Pisolithus sp. B1]|nr:glyoxalase-like domain-containing protein [Pisolithus sp. B1]